MTTVLLHLSDIHIRSEKDWILDKGERIASCVYSVLPEATTVFVVVSGDVAFSGKANQYEAAKDLLNTIKSFLVAEKKIPVHFVIVPGNHDCDFDLSNKTRLMALNGVRAAPSEFDDSILETGVSVQAGFFSFADAMHTPDETRQGDKLWTCHRFTVEGKEVVFDALNVSWCSNLHEEPGTLIFPCEQYSKHLEEVVDLRFAVLHHPLNWFSQATYHPFRHLVRGVANVVISGHEHVGGVGEDLNAESGHSAYVEGCVLQGDVNLAESSFNIVVLNLDEGAYQSTRYQWTADAHYSASEEGSWNDFRSLPKKIRNRTTLSKPFDQLLSDPGGAFESKASPVSLSDLYVHPDMLEPLEKGEKKQILSTSILADPGRTEGGVLLTGEEKVGATSLLFMLFRAYHDSGYIPLYIRGADLKGSTERDVDAAIKKAVVEQYGESYWEKYEQSTNTSKILLLDDFDDGPIKAEQQRAKLLVAVTARFPRFVVTANEVFDFEGSVQPHAKDSLAKMKNFKILPLGYTLRAQLVRRWFHRTAGDGSLDEAAFLARCDQGERLLDAVMARNIVPALPLYLLTLLQSFDAGVSGGFEESGLGDYYDFLVKEGLRSAGIQKHQWNAVIEYCSHLAWQLHDTQHKEISIEDLRKFNDQFSKVQHSVDFESRLRDLINSRVMAKSGVYIRFRYHYIYYFLKGRFLSSHLTDDKIQAHIRDCCAHLYVRENANTILFLAHHAFNSPMFLECIVESVNAPFKASQPIGFTGKDTEPLKDFVRNLPKLKYSGDSPEVVRERANRRRDEIDDGDDGMAEGKEDGAENNFVAQLISQFKTVEILGQILKNQIASVPRAKRVELLQLLMKGPLRAAQAYFEIFMADKDQALIALGEMLAKNNVLESDEKRQDMAHKLLAFFAQSASYGFIMKAVVSISSDALLEDIDTAASIIDSPAARLIAVGVRLDSPGDLPLKEIKELIDETTSDFIATRVLQLMILRRLYMFRTTEKDKQWLSSKNMLDIKAQHAVEFRTRKTKLLKG